MWPQCEPSWLPAQRLEGARSTGKSEPHLELPEDAARVPVVVVSQGDVLQAGAVCLQVLLHVLEEPRLVVIANAIQLQ